MKISTRVATLLALSLLVGMSAPRRARAELPPVELGAFGGWHNFSPESELGRLLPHDAAAKSFVIAGPRLGVLLHQRLSIEMEAGVIPTTTRTGDASTVILSLRAQLLLQLMPEAALRPFLVGGGGSLSSLTTSDATRFVRDTDGGVHIGAGIKIPLTRAIGLRVEGRGLLFPAMGAGRDAWDWEALAGVYLRLGRELPKPAAAPALAPAAPPPAPPVEPAAETAPPAPAAAPAATPAPAPPADKAEADKATEVKPGKKPAKKSTRPTSKRKRR
jgi:hypothetical protein